MPNAPNDKPNDALVSGLRTRFFPKSRIGQGLISVAPWLDILVLMMLFVLLQAHFVLQPGVLIRLPETRFADGSRPAMAMVVLSLPTEPGRPSREIVFFDDARYLIGSERYMNALREALGAQAQTRPEGDLAILADESVAHGTVMMLCDMAREAGIAQVNLASKTTE